MVFKFLKWLITPQPRRLSQISDDARGAIQSGKPELGMEAIDLDMVAKVVRRNQSLERASAYYGQRKWWGISNADTSPLIKFEDDDPDYARKYHEMFQAKGKRK